MKAAIYKGIKQMACEERPKPTIIDDGDAIIRVVRALSLIHISEPTRH